jgi:hypothetical protein
MQMHRSLLDGRSYCEKTSEDAMSAVKPEVQKRKACLPWVEMQTMKLYQWITLFWRKRESMRRLVESFGKKKLYQTQEMTGNSWIATLGSLTLLRTPR